MKFWNRATMLTALCLSIATPDARAGSLADRILVKEIIVPASRERVWAAWTTAEGLQTFLVGRAEVELRVGGKYELFFNPDAPEGERGSEGCTILSLLLPEMLSFTWNAPPSIPKLREAKARTQVIIYFDEVNGSETKVRLAQLGFGEGPDWEKYYSYFDRAWGNVLAGLKDSIAAIPAKNDVAKPDPRLGFEIQVEAPVGEVWAAFTTKKGIESWMVPLAEIDLRRDGFLRTNYNAQGTIGDAGGITHRVMTFEPNRLIAFQIEKCPEGFPHAAATMGTWWVVRLDAETATNTNVRLTSGGLGEGSGADAMIEHFERGNRQTLEKLKQRFATAKAKP